MRAGTMEVPIPKLREGFSFPTWLLDRRKRPNGRWCRWSRPATCSECRPGVWRDWSKRWASPAVESQVRVVARGLDEQVADIRGERDGHREILGVEVTSAGAGAGWLAFFGDLGGRCLSGVSLVTRTPADVIVVVIPDGGSPAGEAAMNAAPSDCAHSRLLVPAGEALDRTPANGGTADPSQCAFSNAASTLPSFKPYFTTRPSPPGGPLIAKQVTVAEVAPNPSALEHPSALEPFCSCAIGQRSHAGGQRTTAVVSLGTTSGGGAGIFVAQRLGVTD